MKREKIFYALSSAFLILVSVSGCYSIDDTQKEWTDKGETIYVGKLDSLQVRSGMNRVEIVGDTRYLRTAETCTVRYDVMDEQGLSVEKVNEYKIADVVGDDGKARLIVDGLESGSYYFDVMTFDAYGNRSVPSQVYGVAYGEEDIMVETPRRITAVTPRPDGSVNIEWNDAECTYVDMVYDDAEGKEQSMRIEGNPSVTNIVSWLPGGRITVSTFILKNENDLDMLALEPLEYEFPTGVVQSVPRFGQGSVMNLGPSADWDLLESFTIELKARYTELAQGDQCVISCETNSNSGFMLRSSGNNLQFYIGDGNWRGISTGPLETGVWYDIAVTYRPGRIELYVDGDLKASSEDCGTMLSSPYPLQIGTSPYYSNRYMRGDIQHVSIWAQVRTADQIKADVEAGYGFTGEEEGLKAYWPLTVNYGSPLPDQTGQHEATFTNVTWNEVQ